MLIVGTESVAIHPGVAHTSSDIIVVKRRFSAFYNTELDTILRAHGIKHLIIFGVRTAGVVLSSVRSAADMDYACTVVHDLCRDQNAQIHKTLCELVLPIQATVIDTKTLTQHFSTLTPKAAL